MEQVGFRPLDIALDGVGSFGELFWVGLRDNPQLRPYCLWRFANAYYSESITEGKLKKLKKQLEGNKMPFDM